MTPRSASDRWLGRLSRLLLGLCVLASAVPVALPVLAFRLWQARSSPAGAPVSVSALAFPLALLFLLVLEIPALAVALVLWRGYLAVRRRHARRRRAKGD